jgi:hypothetical protein
MDKYALLMVLGREGPARLATDEDVISRQKKMAASAKQLPVELVGRNFARPDLFVS